MISSTLRRAQGRHLKMKDSLFGTDGIRERVGSHPLTQELLPKIGDAIALWLQKKYGSSPTILIAQDTRESCAYIKSLLKSGLLRHSVTVHDAFVLPTPAVHKLVQSNQFSCGIIISASHNAYADNGIKIVDGITGKLTAQDEHSIAAIVAQESSEFAYRTFGAENFYSSAAQDYQHLVTAFFQPNFLRDMRVVLDCANGATSTSAPAIFEHLGAHVIPLNTTPNGRNINHQCGAVHPQQLQQTVQESKADIGFAFDGDGDRLTVVTRDGRIYNGDDILALLSGHPTYAAQNTIVSTVMANQGLEAYLEEHDKKLIRTPVGDKFVAQTLTEQNVLLGGEQSGHIILADYAHCSDGIFAALRVMEVMLFTANRELKSFIPFPQVLLNMPVKQKKSLTQEPCASLIAATQAQLPGGRLLVRYSGTENLLRILVEDADAQKAHNLSAQLARQLEKELG